MKVRKIIVTLILGLLLLTDLINSVGAESTSSAEALWATEQIVSDGSVEPHILAEVSNNMAISRAYAKAYLGINPPGQKVFVSANPKWMTDKYLEVFELGEVFRPGKMQQFSDCKSGSIAEGGLAGIFIMLCHKSWKDPPQLRKVICAHEWWHANVQWHLLNAFCCSDNNRMQIAGPEWLMEGSADVWALLVLNNFANSPDQEIAWLRGWLRGKVPIDFNLLDLNTRRGWREVSDEYKYEVVELANWMLMKTAGLSSFLDFYRKLGKYFASEADKIGLANASHWGQPMTEFRDGFFDSLERYQKLDEIFRSAFGRTMVEFAEEFRVSLH